MNRQIRRDLSLAALARVREYIISRRSQANPLLHELEAALERGDFDRAIEIVQRMDTDSPQ
jgi:hypothetical protein